MTNIFDTLKFTKRAIAAGIPQQAAEFHAEEIATLINDSLVTKEHFDSKISTLEKHIKTEMKTEIASLENRLTWKFLGGMITMITLSQVIGHFFK